MFISSIDGITACSCDPLRLRVVSERNGGGGEHRCGQLGTDCGEDLPCNLGARRIINGGLNAVANSELPPLLKMEASVVVIMILNRYFSAANKFRTPSILSTYISLFMREKK
jgi:hypothetical protein